MRKIYADNSSIRDPKFYTEPDYANYKYVLNLPGKTDGSYSRNLNHLWYVGAAVLLWDTPSVEWYYPALKHGATHAAINRTTARAVVAALDAHVAAIEGQKRLKKEINTKRREEKIRKLLSLADVRRHPDGSGRLVVSNRETSRWDRSARSPSSDVDEPHLAKKLG